MQQNSEEFHIDTVDEPLDAIASPAARGAPALGIAGAFGVALSAHQHTVSDRLDARAVPDDEERTARPGPTAVNPLRIVAHCNTGSPATGAWGTALGAVRGLHGRGRVEGVPATETGPLLQGARPAAGELQQDGILVRLCPNAAAASAVQAGDVDCVVVGANRVTDNGDAAGKTGTYPPALAAARHGVPFVVVAPQSTVDEATPTGAGIPVERRSPDEVAPLAGKPSAPPGTDACAPAFGVTPHDLVTTVVTEVCVREPAATAAGVADLPASPQVFPSPGGVFRELAGVCSRPGPLRPAARKTVDRARGRCDAVAVVKAPGFVPDAAVAAEAGLPLVPARRPGKTPGTTQSVSCRSAHSPDAWEVPIGALGADDVPATEGTPTAVRSVVEACGAAVERCAVLTGMAALNGAARLAPIPVDALRTVTAVPQAGAGGEKR